MSAMVGALFFVRKGREAAFTTLPPLFVRHPPLHREGYNKVTPSAARPFCGRAARKDFAKQKICGKKRRKPSGQAARNAAADLRALRRRGGKGGREAPAITPSVMLPSLTTPPSCLWQATVSAAQGKRRLGQEISPQWEISKLAGGQRAHLVAARRCGLRRASFAA